MRKKKKKNFISKFFHFCRTTYLQFIQFFLTFIRYIKWKLFRKNLHILWLNSSCSKLIFFFFKFNFQHWELIVLSRLKWDISSITPLDFLELLLSRLPITHRNCTDINLDKIRKHAQAFISLAARGEQKKKLFQSIISVFLIRFGFK